MSELSSPTGPTPVAAGIAELVGFRLSTATVLFHAAVAERLGLGPTDMKCYSILRQSGPLTAGELAERTSLTTGAITGVIDRLERANLIRRARDPHDRRRVVLELLHDPERERAIDALYAPMGRAIGELLDSLSEQERATIYDFLTRGTAILEAATRNLRAEAPERQKL
jgi:DNA-binding MarR family transcriptional regulator